MLSRNFISTLFGGKAKFMNKKRKTSISAMLGPGIVPAPRARSGATVWRSTTLRAWWIACAIVLYSCAHFDRAEAPPGFMLGMEAARSGVPTLPAVRQVANVLARYRVVALGEATHGTHEIFETKRLLVKELVQTHGFRAFALEASHGRTLALDRAVRLGEGDVRTAVADVGFWIWNTEEMVALFESLRDWNLSRPLKDRVRVFGFDVISNEPTVDALRYFFRTYFNGFSDTLEAAVQPLDGSIDLDLFAKRSAEDKERSLRALRELVGVIDSNRAQLEPKAGRQAVDDAIDHLSVLLRFHETYMQPYFNREQPESAAVHRRESRMAANILSALQGWASGKRMLVWAHNAHVSRSQNLGFAPDGYTGFAPDGKTMVLPAMGHYLAETLGGDYYVVALTVGPGRSRARVQTGVPSTHLATAPHDLPASLPGSVEANFTRWCREGCFVDLAAAGWKPWSECERPMLLLGGLFDAAWPTEYSTPSLRISEHFDSMLFLPRSTPSRPTPTGDRPALPLGNTGQ